MIDTDDATDARTPGELREALLDAMLLHVPFDGWSESGFRASWQEAGIPREMARVACPRGAVDLALAWDARGDAAMLERLKRANLASMRFRERIAAAVRYRLEAIEDREVARRSAALFALPHHAPDGAAAIWRTVDLIWTALGDDSQDYNWYTKRATLSAVYSATLLYWLGDNSPLHQATWGFLDRRIDEVMRFEKARNTVGDNPIMRTLLAGPLWALSHLRPPRRGPEHDLPGGPGRAGGRREHSARIVPRPGAGRDLPGVTPRPPR